MEKSELNENHQDKEIGLYDLWVILKKRRIPVFLVILISLIAASGYAALAQKVYQVSNTLVLTQIDEFITKAQVVAAIKELDGDLALQKYDTEYLGARVKGLAKIKNIKASDVKGSETVRVDIETLDKESGIALMEALPEYIQTRSFLAVKLNMRKTLMKKNMDDLKRIIDKPTRDFKLTTNTVVFVPSIDLYTLREKYNSLLIMLENLEEGKIIQLASKTELSGGQYKPKRARTILVGLIIGCFLGMLVAFILEWSGNNRSARGLN